MITAALGFSVHTGWAAMVALAGPTTKPRVVGRSRIALAGDGTIEERQAYHRAAELPIARARTFVTAAVRAAEEAARRSLGAELATLRGEYAIDRGAIVGGNSALPEQLDDILRSHALIHAAEGAMFRRAVAAGCARHGVAVIEIASKQLADHAARVLDLAGTACTARMTELGRGLGSPWARDQKDAALVAWLALARR